MVLLLPSPILLTYDIPFAAIDYIAKTPEGKCLALSLGLYGFAECPSSSLVYSMSLSVSHLSSNRNRCIRFVILSSQRQRAWTCF